MNQRIENLLYHSGLTASGCWEKFDDYDKDAMEQFARLMLQECIDVIQGMDPGYKDYRNQIEDAFRRDLVLELKQHFGVVE